MRQLDLKGEGLLVEHVGKEGAAAKAGIQVNDILLAANAKPLKKPADVEVVLTDGKEIAFKVCGRQTDDDFGDANEARRHGA